MSRPLRLLVVTNNLGGGTGAHLVGLLEHLDRSRWSAQVLCQGERDLAPPSHVPLIEPSRSGRLNRFPLAQIRQLLQLRRAVRSFRPDVVHSYFFWPIMYARILRRLGLIPYLVENREDQGFNLSKMDYRLMRATAHVPDRVICVSEAVREVVLEREGIPQERARVIRNGISLSDDSRPSPRDLLLIRQRLGFLPEHRIVGMVANLNRAVKGVRYFVESMPLILEEVPEARFLILGDGHEREGLTARAAELGVGERVVFAGFRPDVARFYPVMDVSVLTSLSEGLSITVLESMAHGLPVVATRVGGNPELIRDGQTGFLVPPRDPQSFASAVARVLNDRPLGERMGREGRRVVERDFSLPRVVESYEQVYTDTLSDGS